MTLYADKYGDTLSLEPCNEGDVHLASMDQDYLFDRKQAEALSAAIVVTASEMNGKPSFKCNSGDGSTVRPARLGSGLVCLSTKTPYSKTIAQVELIPADALELAFELIRMATNE